MKLKSVGGTLSKVVSIKPAGSVTVEDPLTLVLEERAEKICVSILEGLYKDFKDKPDVMVFSSVTRPVGQVQNRRKYYSTDVVLKVDGEKVSFFVRWEIKGVSVTSSYVLWGVVLPQTVTGSDASRLEENLADIGKQIYA